MSEKLTAKITRNDERLKIFLYDPEQHKRNSLLLSLLFNEVLDSIATAIMQKNSNKDIQTEKPTVIFFPYICYILEILTMPQKKW